MFKERFPLAVETEKEINGHLKLESGGIQIRKLEKVNERKTAYMYRKSMRSGYATYQNTHLARGLKFTVTPKNIPYQEFILAPELACQKTQEPREKAELHNAVAGILTTAKLP